MIIGVEMVLIQFLLQGHLNVLSFKDGKSNFGDHTQGFENFIGADFDDVVFATNT